MNILTFDVEEWFHILDNESTKTADTWNNYECRIHKNVERILDLLNRHDQIATFFCLGWIVDEYPDVIKQIVRNGHNVGSHSCMHQLAYEQSPEEFGRDLERSIKTLEDVSGQKVNTFRVPGFSITENTKWAFEILVAQGIEFDCSVFPARRGHGGMPSYREGVPSIIRYNGIELKELPISYATVFDRPVVFSGGGYFRLCPYTLIKHWTKKSNYVMSYLHPRDFDPDQPVIRDLSLIRKFKSYVGVGRAAAKLERWLSDFEFIDVETAVERIDWAQVPVVDIADSHNL